MRTTRQTRRAAKRLFRLCVVDRLLESERVRHIVRRVGAARARNRIAVLSEFLRLTKLYVARHAALVESASPLPADLQMRIETGLTRIYGPGLATSFAQRSSLIGGVRIEVGGDVYDGSIRASLGALETSV